MNAGVKVPKRTKDRSKCKEKVPYQTEQDAILAWSEHMARVLFSTMVVYSCRLHKAFHLGHDRFMPKPIIVTRTRKFKSNRKAGG